MIPFLSSLLPTVNNIIDRVVPDKNAQAQAKIELATLAAKGELDQMAGQLKINMKEAESPSIFVAGWRPFVGWVCGCSLALLVVVMVFGSIIASMAGMPVAQMNEIREALTTIMNTVLMPILTAMLGFRTFEKVRGVHRDSIKQGENP